MNRTWLGAAATAAALVTLSVAHADEVKWTTEYEAALKAAKKESKVVLVDFTGSDWCGWCMKLHDEVFSKPEFKEWADKNVILVELDFPKKKALAAELKKQNDGLLKKFGVKGFPTILFVDGDGKELGRTGYKPGGPAEWIKAADAARSGAVAKGKDGKGEGVKKGDPKPDAAKPDAAKPDAKAEDTGAGEWGTSWDKAVAASKASKKLILADFTGSDWCGWCIKLKEEVFSKPEFKEWAKKNVVLLELDFPRRTPQADDVKEQNKKLAEKYGIEGFPTILVLDAEGKKVGELGYMEGGPAAWTKAAQAILEKK